jgi:hypothetical protein
MNKTMKIALYIGLTGLGMFVWTHFAAAKGKPSQAPVVVTFISGDVSAAPQVLDRGPQGGPFTATIDFAKHLAYPAGGGSAADWQDILRFFEARNPITYDSLQISALATDATNEGKAINSRLDFKVVIDGHKYTVTMNAFVHPELTEFTPTLVTYHWHEGRFAIMRDNKLVVEAGCCGGRPSVDLSITR